MEDEQKSIDELLQKKAELRMVIAQLEEEYQGVCRQIIQRQFPALNDEEWTKEDIVCANNGL